MLFKSPTPHEILPREILQRRLLLCLFGLGTNVGIKRVASGSQAESYRDLLYVLRRYINKDGLGQRLQKSPMLCFESGMLRFGERQPRSPQTLKN